jgi:hypothetical protein
VAQSANRGPAALWLARSSGEANAALMHRSRVLTEVADTHSVSRFHNPLFDCRLSLPGTIERSEASLAPSEGLGSDIFEVAAFVDEPGADYLFSSPLRKLVISWAR